MVEAQMELGAPSYEDGMNPEQVAAIRHGEGPCALLAVAGCGKTAVVVRRIARLVQEGVDPSQILAVTFSTKAAAEMNERLEKIGVDTDEARVGTWHSLCLQILRDDETQWAGWEIGEEHEQKALVREVLDFKHLDWKAGDAGKVSRYISYCKANLAEPGSDLAEDLMDDFFAPHERAMGMRAYALYEQLIEEKRMLTFDDFLVFAHRHLSTNEQARLRWAARWGYVLVDEAQDNNLAQKSLQHLLARDHRNLMLVGDPAQAIYSFRASSPQYLIGFSREWGAETIVMHRNYRCGRAIVRVANAIIAPSEVRLPREMVAERDVEGHVEVRVSESFDEEGEDFADWVEGHHTDGHALKSIVALFRTNAQSRALEEALLRRKIPHVVVGGTSFYDRKEVKDLLAYLRVGVGRDPDGDAVRRCINAPFRYLGAAFVRKVMEVAAQFGPTKPGSMPWHNIVDRAAQLSGVQQRQKHGAGQWSTVVQTVARRIEHGEGPAALLDGVVKATEYVEWLEREEAESLEGSRGANVRELVRLAERFEGVGHLLDYVEEMQAGAKKQKVGRGDKVLLLSIHRSKAMEFPHVWVSGCNEAILPHAMGDEEEERRLMYVAATRARDELVLSRVRRFATRRGVQEAEPSRYLRDAGLVV